VLRNREMEETMYFKEVIFIRVELKKQTERFLDQGSRFSKFVDTMALP
jgi:hypothetical protein